MPDLEKIKIKDIKPSPYNPRTIDHKELKKLSNSMKEFGIIDPIIVNLNNMNIVGGHQRYSVLEHEGVQELNMIRLGKIGWVFKETEMDIPDEDTEKMVNISLNNIKGQWDDSKLTQILSDLEKKGKNFKLTGFDELDLKGMKLDHEVLVNVDELRTSANKLKDSMNQENSPEVSGEESNDEYVEGTDEEIIESDVPETEEEFLEELNEGLVRDEDDFVIAEVGTCPHCGKEINVDEFINSVTTDLLEVVDGLDNKEE